MNATTTPRIYVASLSDYNNGELHGDWIDANQDPDAIRDAIAKILRESKHPNVTVPCDLCEGTGTLTTPGADGTFHPCHVCDAKGQVPSAEEWAIHDYEGFAGLKLSEGHDIDEVAALAEFIEDQDDEDLIGAAVDVSDGTSAEELRKAIEERYRGTYDNPADYAAETFEDIYSDALEAMPDVLRNHIDWDGIARDLEMGGDVSFIRRGGSVYVFDNNA